MWSLAVFLFLLLSLYLWLKYILERNFIKAQKYYSDIQDECAELLEVNTKIQEDNFGLESLAEENIALYDITRDLCKSLEEEKVFSIFKKQLSSYIGVEECKFIKDNIDIAQYRDNLVVPLKIERTVIGYLIAGGLKEEDKEKFHILVQQFVLGMKRAFLYQRVQAIAITDSLTGVFSRRYCLERFHEEIQRSKKFKHSSSFMMVDIDYFKSYNDKYGHLVGDAILHQVAATIKENVRQIDLVGRYGGEEFAIVLVELGTEQSQIVAERIRKAVEGKSIKVYDEELKVTISLGVSTFPKDAQEAQGIIDKADQALYRAKESGRNRIYLYSQK
jgi:diguanylate cyclase (GGDEF)-like protein